MEEVIKSNSWKENNTPIRYVTDQIYELLVNYMMDICHKKTDESGEKIKFSNELQQQMKQRREELQKVFEDYYFSPKEQRVLRKRFKEDKKLTWIVKDNYKAKIQKENREKGRYVSAKTYDFLQKVVIAYQIPSIRWYTMTTEDFDALGNLVEQMNILLVQEWFTDTDLTEILYNVERWDLSHIWCYHPNKKEKDDDEQTENMEEIKEESYALTKEIYQKLKNLKEDCLNIITFNEIDERITESIKERFRENFNEIKNDLKKLTRENIKIDTFLRKRLTWWIENITVE